MLVSNIQDWVGTARDFFVFMAEQFREDRCHRAAAELAYTTLLALVPLFTVLFITLSAFPAFSEWRTAIEDFIFRNFVPALGEQVRAYLLDFSTKAAKLRAVGIIFLIITVLMMMSTVESTFNVIWSVRRRRPLALRFLLYWAILTLGPILVGAGIVGTSYLVSLPLWTDPLEMLGGKGRLLSLLPWCATTVAFVLCFRLIPYRPVLLRHAVIGGVIASTLFEFAKRGFAYYVTHFPTQEAIYGAFATVPIFLVWIYLSWVIVLVGAEITQCLTTFPSSQRRVANSLTGNPLYVAYRTLKHLHDAQSSGLTLSERALWRRERALGYNAIDAALARLADANWVSRDDRYRWLLLRDLATCSLGDLITIMPTTPVNFRAMPQLDAADQRFVAALDRYRESFNAACGEPLRDMFEESPGADVTLLQRTTP